MSAARAFHAMMLAATARSATAAARAVADRRAGRDASAQESAATASSDLAALAEDLAHAALQLRLRAATPPLADPEADAVQTFQTRVLLADAARALAMAHRKQLSLYPAVSAEAVEGTRVLARTASEAAAMGGDLGELAHRIGAWARPLRFSESP